MGLEGNLRQTERLNLSAVCGRAAFISASIDVDTPDNRFFSPDSSQEFNK
jgi:hypothetical protein